MTPERKDKLLGLMLRLLTEDPAKVTPMPKDAPNESTITVRWGAK